MKKTINLCLDCLLGKREERIKLLGEKSEEFVRAEERLINALCRYDNFLAAINDKIQEKVFNLKNIIKEDASYANSAFRINQEELNGIFEKRSEYMKRVYYTSESGNLTNTADNLFRNPKMILLENDSSLYDTAERLYMTANHMSRIYALNEMGELNKSRIDYFLSK